MKEMLLKIEGFQYEITLDLNTSYFYIDVLHGASKLFIVLIYWSKYEYL